MATRTISVAGGNWTASTAWDEGMFPSAGDDVVARSGGDSGNLTVNSICVCRSLNFDNYAGTFTFNGSRSVTLSIGGGTAGAGNVALKMVAGMTVSFSTAAFNLISTSSTQQSITSAGKLATATSLNCAGVGGSWILADDLAVLTLAITNGSFESGNKAIAVNSFNIDGALARTVTLGTSVITINNAGGGWLATTVTNLTFSGASSTIILTDVSSTNKTFAGGGLTYGTLSITTGGTGIITFTGSNTFATMVTTGGSTKTIKFTAGTTTTLTGGTDAFFSGAASNLITIASVTDTSAWNLSKTSGTVSCDYLSLRDSAAAGGATFYAGANSTDVSGNSGWSFTAAPSGGKPTHFVHYARLRAA